MKYCPDTALQFGTLTALHYSDTYLQNGVTRRLINLTEVQFLTAEEVAALGDEDGACILEILTDDGTMMRENLSGLRAT